MNIQVSYDTLYTGSQSLKSKASQYQSLINTIQNKMQSISSIWQGSDSQAFTSQAAALQPRLNQMKTIIDQYAATLQSSGSAYESLQRSCASGARMLSI